jgi:hypothetical protein
MMKTIDGVPRRHLPGVRPTGKPKAPREIRLALNQGMACYHARAFTGAAIMCGKTFDVLSPRCDRRNTR